MKLHLDDVMHVLSKPDLVKLHELAATEPVRKEMSFTLNEFHQHCERGSVWQICTVLGKESARRRMTYLASAMVCPLANLLTDERSIAALQLVLSLPNHDAHTQAQVIGQAQVLAKDALEAAKVAFELNHRLTNAKGTYAYVAAAQAVVHAMDASPDAVLHWGTQALAGSPLKASPSPALYEHFCYNELSKLIEMVEAHG